MNAKLALVAKSAVAAALAAAGLAAPVTSFASPDDGMVCRPGYQAQAANGNFKCTKLVPKTVGLDCTNLRFPNKVIRAPGAPGDTSGGRDICTRPGISIGTTDALTGLVERQDFVFAEVSPARLAATREAVERAEERNLGLNDGDVDAQAGTASVVVNGGFGSNDEARFTVTLFTFPIPALNLNAGFPINPIGPIVNGPRLP
jgi:hypothetical protein